MAARARITAAAAATAALAAAAADDADIAGAKALADGLRRSARAITYAAIVAADYKMRCVRGRAGGGRGCWGIWRRTLSKAGRLADSLSLSLSRFGAPAVRLRRNQPTKS